MLCFPDKNKKNDTLYTQYIPHTTTKMFDVYYYNPICRMIELVKWIRENDSQHLRKTTRQKFLEYYEKNEELDNYIAKYSDYYIWYLNNHLTKKHTNSIQKCPEKEVNVASRLITRTLINSN